MRHDRRTLAAFGAGLGLVLSLPGVVLAALTIGDVRELVAFLPFVLVPSAALGVALVLGLARQRT